MIWFLCISVFILFLYFHLIYTWFLAWNKAPGFNPESSETSFLTILVPFFNESDNLPDIVKDFEQIEYPQESFEVIFIDDHSTDDSFNRLRDLIQYHENFLLLKNSKNMGKKYALKTGVEKARGQIILTTDADCSINPEWLQLFSGYFNHYPETLLLSSGVIMESSNRFSGMFQALEFSSLIAAGAASFMKGSPIMCNGANLAFNKDLFMEAFPYMYPDINTGDDMFLMLYAKKTNPGRLSFLKSADSFVKTNPALTWRKFMKQRMRWASKATFYRDLKLIYTSLVIFLTNSLLTFFLAMTFFDYRYLLFFFLILAGKSLPDYLLLKSFLTFSGQKDILKFFLPSQLVNMIYIPVTAIAGIILSPERKKQR